MSVLTSGYQRGPRASLPFSLPCYTVTNRIPPASPSPVLLFILTDDGDTPAFAFLFRHATLSYDPHSPHRRARILFE